MKVVQIINSLATGGAEKLLLDTIPLYRKAGVEMDVLVFWNNDHQFVTALKALDCCKVIVLKQSGNYKDIYSLSHIWKLRKYLKEYDIAHVHLFPAQYFTALANIAVGNKCRLIFTEHNTTNTRMNSFVLSRLDRLFYKRYMKIVAITDDVNRVLKNYLKSTVDKILTIENGVDLSVAEKAVCVNKESISKGFNSDTKLIVQVAGFRMQKDQDTLINALSFLPDNFNVLLVGDGERRKSLQELVNKLEMNARVHFLGVRQDVFSILKVVDYVVVSSHWEGFGLAAVEGMLAGKPVLASEVDGLSAVVKGAGILFEKGNAEDLSNKLLELDSNSDLYNKVVKAGLKRALQYDIQNMVDKHIELYKNIYEA